MSTVEHWSAIQDGPSSNPIKTKHFLPFSSFFIFNAHKLYQQIGSYILNHRPCSTVMDVVKQCACQSYDGCNT